MYFVEVVKPAGKRERDGRVYMLVLFFSLSFPHYVTPTERERETDKKNVFPAPNAHDDEPGAPVSLEQGEKPRRAEKAKTPSGGTIGVEIRDFGRGVERKKKCIRNISLPLALSTLLALR